MSVKLEPGVNVDIQRSNGQIQSAVVDNIDWDGRNVHVKWSESEQIRGKAIDLGLIFLLNPSLRQSVAETCGNSSKVMPLQLGVGPSLSTGPLNTSPKRSRQTIEISKSVPSEPIPVVPLSLVTTKKKKPKGKVSASKSSINLYTPGRTSKAELDKIKKQKTRQSSPGGAFKASLPIVLPKVVSPRIQKQCPFLAMIDEYRAQLEYKPITMADNRLDSKSDSHTICVAVRKRPLNPKEIKRNDIDVVTVPNKDMIVVHEPRHKVDLTRYLENQKFRFDYSFDEMADNQLVYRYTARPLVKTIFEGGMATCIAYGQTGSGKTHTMGGDFDGKSQDSTNGIYGLAAKDVFRLVECSKYRSEGLTVFSTFFEIYGGKVFDLLNRKTELRVLEDAKQRVQLVGIKEKRVVTVDDVLQLIQMGTTIRTSGVTSANSHSSRSHAVFQIILRKGSTKLKGKLSLIDLAGNERGADNGSACRSTRAEGAQINKSLLALKECIRALGRKGAHLPFRASKLTQVLRDSFIGKNSRTCMIAMISPGIQSCDHSLNTLRYADRVKELGADEPDLKASDNEEDMDDNDQYMDTIDEEVSDEDNGDDLAFDLEEEVPDQLYTIDEEEQHLYEVAEEVIEQQKNYVESLPEWTQSYGEVLDMTTEVDYDVDLYVKYMEQLLDQNIAALLNVKEKVVDFRTELNR